VAVYIPSRDVIPKINNEDPLDYYFRPLTRGVYRKRPAMMVDLLGETQYAALLEIGYGSGILLPELSRHTRRLVAIDLHEKPAAVDAMLKREGVRAELLTANLYAMPFADGSFDALFCMSVLEHLTELDRALNEFVRVTRPGATLVFGFPVRNLVTDAFFRLAHFDPRAIHPSSHRDIERAIAANPRLRLDRRVLLPRFLPADLALYDTCRCSRVEG